MEKIQQDLVRSKGLTEAEINVVEQLDSRGIISTSVFRSSGGSRGKGK